MPKPSTHRSSRPTSVAFSEIAGKTTLAKTTMHLQDRPHCGVSPGETRRDHQTKRSGDFNVPLRTVALHNDVVKTIIQCRIIRHDPITTRKLPNAVPSVFRGRVTACRFET